jgi:hypothetical protein
MAEPLFIAVTPFDPSDGEAWRKYCEWAKIPNLTEIISLDSILCHRLINEFQDEDWPHIINENFRLNYFRELAYMLRRVADVPRKRILGVYRNPDFHISQPPADDFVFIGYDLIEETTQISALTNCGGFPDSFSNAELNRYGLIEKFDRAEEIHQSLPKLHPEEPHAHCELYAVWKRDAEQPK